jgi:DNA-binding response OmpR family regulator
VLRRARYHQGVPESTAPLRILVYSDNPRTREQVRLALGKRVHPELPELTYLEVATPPMVIRQMDEGGFDLVILDGEATPAGGMGIAKQLKDEIADCPPVLVLTGRADDKWLASWSRAEAAVPHPIDPIKLADAVVALLSTSAPGLRVTPHRPPDPRNPTGSGTPAHRAKPASLSRPSSTISPTSLPASTSSRPDPHSERAAQKNAVDNAAIVPASTSSRPDPHSEQAAQKIAVDNAAIAETSTDGDHPDLRSTLDWWDKYAAIPLTVLFVAGAGLCAAFLKRPSGQEGIYGWVLTGQIACIVLAAAIPAYTTLRSKRREANAAAAAARREKSIRQREIDATIKARVEVGSALDPIVRSLADGAADLRNATPQAQTGIRDALRAAVVGLAVQITPQIMGPKGSTRSCYLNFDPGPPKRKLALSRYRAGRQDAQARTEFVEGTVHGDYVIKKVTENEADFFPDLDDKAPEGFDVKSVRYRTFISVPVVAGDTAYGLLTVDALKAGQLSELDLDLMRVMAGLVATAMAMAHEPPTAKSR